MKRAYPFEDIEKFRDIITRLNLGNKIFVPLPLPSCYAQPFRAQLKESSASFRYELKDQVPQEEQLENIQRHVSKRIKLEAYKKKKFKGESRLRISFENLGQLGKVVQVSGRYGDTIIPDGLCGTHMLYSQRWRFEITHEQAIDGVIRLSWKLTNLESSRVHALTETIDEAISRQERGRTIASKIFQQAVKDRCTELQKDLLTEVNELRRSNLTSLVRILAPKQLTEGSLVFGLQHQVVQDKMRDYLNSSVS